MLDGCRMFADQPRYAHYNCAEFALMTQLELVAPCPVEALWRD